MTAEKSREPAVAAAGAGGKGPGEALAMVARQPVYDAGMAVVAYELLYREAASALKAMVTDTRRTTLRVIANAALEIGLDKLAGGVARPHSVSTRAAHRRRAASAGAAGPRRDSGARRPARHA